MKPKPTKYKNMLDFETQSSITLEHYKKPLREERWLEKANTAFREGLPRYHIPRSDVFYIKVLIRDRLGYDLPVLLVEQMLIEEGLLGKGGNPLPKPPSEEALDKTQETENPPF